MTVGELAETLNALLDGESLSVKAHPSKEVVLVVDGKRAPLTSVSVGFDGRITVNLKDI